MIRRIVLNFHVDRACFRGGDAAKSFGWKVEYAERI